jgi:NAD(P)-dependent dehydrogenase (short-subunit alcohol dehydrogenase family)
LVSGRTAVITGAASGIGRSLALRLARHGCPVAIADINESDLNETASAISAVFNNAGVGVASTVMDAVPADDEWLWNINFHGVVNGTRAFLPILVEQDSGAIVNTSSVYGLAGMPAQSAYCAAKFAVRGFTDALRQELRGTGVRAITVHPGGINTNIARNARWHIEPDGGLTREQEIDQFAAMALTQPDRAAEIIHRGVEAGRARILIGPDAYVFDALARLTPSHYYDVLDRLLRLLKKRGRALHSATV